MLLYYKIDPGIAALNADAVELNGPSTTYLSYAKVTVQRRYSPSVLFNAMTDISVGYAFSNFTPYLI